VTAESKQALVAGLVLTHGDQLRRFLVSRVRNPVDIPDILQEVFLRLLRVPDHEAIRSPEAYLFTIARHVAQQHSLRQAAATPTLELQEMLNELATAPTDPALEVSAQQSLEELNRALANLSPRARAAFLFHRRDGLTLEEIGNRFGVSRPQAKKYLAKALVQLRKQLEQAE
jgi:RNA polymerase sigma-70 factor (ECF subfamily)